MNATTTNKDMSRETTLSTNTRITFAALAMLASPLLVGVVLYFKVDAMQQDLKQAWSLQQQVVWSERLGAQNPNLRVPPVEDVIRLVQKKQ